MKLTLPANIKHTLTIILLLYSCTQVHAQQGGVYKDTTVINFFKRAKGVIAMDGCYSIPLTGGKTMWLFGDSYMDDYDTATKSAPCLFEARNSALLQPANNWHWQNTRTLNKGEHTYLQDAAQPNNFLWPGCGYQLKDTVYVFGLNMKNVTGGLGFAKGGDDVWVKLKYPQMEVVGYSYVPGLDSIQFGLGIVHDKASGFIYIYGNKLKGLGATIYLARFKANNPAAGWQFWTGNSWADNIKQIKPITEAPSNSNNITKINNTYVLLSTEFSIQCDNGKHIYASVSNSPVGPFSEHKIIYTITDTVKGHYPFFYLPIAHPEHINDKNELLVTYSINGYEPCVANCVNNRFNPEYYRPQAIRVPVKLLTGK